MKGRDNAYKCSVCGKYIGYFEIDKGDVKIEYEGAEQEHVIMTHRNCEITEKDETRRNHRRR